METGHVARESCTLGLPEYTSAAGQRGRVRKVLRFDTATRSREWRGIVRATKLRPKMGFYSHRETLSDQNLLVLHYTGVGY